MKAPTSTTLVGVDSMLADYERRDATQDEINELPHVADSISFVVWVALVVSGAERFLFYAATTPWRMTDAKMCAENYAQYDRENTSIPGALGLGEAMASNISSAFYAFTFLMSVAFAVLSDAWLGRYITLCLSFCLDFCGCLVLFVTSLPAITDGSVKLVGFILAVILIGLGTGGVKATITPFIGDQYPNVSPQLIITKKGERVVTDRMLTMQYIYNVFYWYGAGSPIHNHLLSLTNLSRFTSIATLSLIASTYLEKKVGYWAAYLMPLCAFAVVVPLLTVWHKALGSQRFFNFATRSVIPQFAKVICFSARDRFRLDAAKPSYQAEKCHREVDWDDLFVSEIKRGLSACKVMFVFPVPTFIVNNLITQAGEMRLDGVPNDAIKAINPVFCIILGPLLQRFLYPGLRKAGIRFGPIARMTWAFVTMSGSMAFAAGVQKLVYSRGPCYEKPLVCEASDGGRIGNDISVWVQIPIFFFLGLAEILGFTTLAEYSYSEAPTNMRTLVQFLGTVSPLSKDPKVLYLYTALAATMVVVASGFWVVFHRYDRNRN
ncbi:hypothetical protein BDV35DRAFT_406446 [Aspergillus flavus]|uniref:Oligopeptide transporter n=1 Tax=Aspergillus flavus TaxID=5059 RepID=A0A5N6GR51_ASPFL|nr:hypothetical protein BDV35DRAFT_406446 [Aspergillus flavus]